jgi:cellulose biosynthesis protein BcsQ
MLSYTTYSEAGGVGKTTTAANLAVAHARAGLKVLVVPLDPQDGNLSRLMGVDDNRADSEVDNLVLHMIQEPDGPFEDLIRTVEGVDIVPEHNRLAALGSLLRQKRDMQEDLGRSFGMFSQLLRVLRDANVPEQYDVLIVDPPATEGPHLYNAILATGSLVIPVEPSAKGQASVEGLESVVRGLEDQLDMEIGVIAAVPQRFKNTRDQREMLDALAYDAPVVIGDRTSLMEGCWKAQCSAFRYVRQFRDRKRDYEIETLAQFDELARHLERQAGVDAPHPPEPGSLEIDTATEAAEAEVSR